MSEGDKQPLLPPTPKFPPQSTRYGLVPPQYQGANPPTGYQGQRDPYQAGPPPGYQGQRDPYQAGPPPGYQGQRDPYQAGPPPGYQGREDPYQAGPPPGYQGQRDPYQAGPPLGYQGREDPYQAGFPPVYQENIPYQVNVIAVQPAAHAIQQGDAFGPSPVQICCPDCQTNIITEIKYFSGKTVKIYAIAMFLLGFLFHVLWCICWVPFILNDLKDVHHYCPNCKNRCGVYKRDTKLI